MRHDHWAAAAERAEKGDGEGERGKGERQMREISETVLRLLTGAASARGLSPALTNLPEYWRRARWPVVAAPRRLPLPLQSQAVRRSPR